MPSLNFINSYHDNDYYINALADSIIFVLGGALGNLFDRIYYSAVPDFIDFHIGIFTGLFLMLQIYSLHIGIICLIYAEIFYNNEKNAKII